MKRVFASTVALLLVVGASSLFLTASSVTVPSGTWAPTGDLNDIRAGAAAVLLSDGVVLVTGGSAADGPVASAERYSVTGGTFIATESMQTPRANHTATVLNDGRVLVVGGFGADAAAVGNAEIYDPATNAWMSAGSLAHARAGHTATLLPDGRVLVAGGESGEGALATLEVYSPVFEGFSLVGTPMTAARMRHAAALAGEKVLITGGWDGAAALATVDVFDPANDSIAAGPAMLSARAEHTATTLLSGNVLVVGGMAADGSDLQSAEVFDAVAGGFVPANAMAAARRNHIAILLPHNNSVLIAGGWSLGTASKTAELYRSWQDGGIFVPTGSSLAPRNWSAGSALSFAASATNRGGPADGLVLVAGGDGASSAELYGFATVKTDKDDYQPGDVVYVSGSGWLPNQTVTFYVRELPAEHFARLVTIDADGAGNISGAKLFDVEAHHLGVRFLMTAADGVSQAHMTFTDGNKLTFSTTALGAEVATFGTFAPNTCVSAFVQERQGINLDPAPAARVVTLGSAPAGVTFHNNSSCGGGPNQVTSVTIAAAATNAQFWFKASATNTYTINGTSPGFSGANTASATVTIQAACTLPSITTGPSSSTLTVGDALNLSVTATGTAPLNYQWKRGATSVGGNSSSYSKNPVTTSDAGSYTVEVSNSCGTATSAAALIIVNKITPTITWNNPADIIYGTALGASQLNATASVGGTFTYTPATGIVLNAGNGQILHVDFTPTDVANYNTASKDVTINVTKATATINITPYSGVYDGLPHSLTGTATGVGAANLSAQLNLGASFTDAPGGSATWTFTGGTNYNDDSGTANVTITKATAVITITPYSGTYDGLPHSLTGTATGVGAANLSAQLNFGASFTDAPGGSATWTFTGGTNYNDDSGTANVTIAKATAVITITPYSGVYDGLPHSLTGTATGVGGANLTAQLNFGASFTDAPGGSATWTFTGGTNYNDDSGTANVTIAKATAVITITPYSGTYDGLPHSLTGTATGVGAANLSAQLNFGASFTDAPGGSATWTFTGGTNYNDDSGTANVTITKATAVITITPYSGVYDGLPHSLTGTATGVGAANLSAQLNFGASFTDAPGGSATWTFTGGTNYNDDSGTANVTIAKATAVITITPYSGTYDGLPHSLTGTATGVGAANLSAQLNFGASFTDAPGGSATWMFTGGTNYNDAGGTAAIVINKANATITVVGYTGVFDGNPHGATGTAVGVGGVNLAASLTLGSSYTFVPGGTATWSFAGGTNYNNANGSVPIVITTACSVFNGFLSPVGGAVEKATGGSFADPVRAFKLNSTVPVKFSATCFEAPLTTGIHTLEAIKYSNSTSADAAIDATPTDAATTGSQFRLTGTEWHFNLSTKALGGNAQGIWLLKATLFDGSSYSVWVEIKK